MTALASATPVTFIITTDAARSRAFYADALELPLGPQDQFATVFALHGAILRVTEVPGFVASAHSVLGWRVPDIVATVTALKAKGIAFTIYEGFGQDELGIWTAPDNNAKVAWFNDPDGNVIGLTQS
jgi:catechol 2,3-dioxygenase-like lactoylglutathione lyase family enzyme